MPSAEFTVSQWEHYLSIFLPRYNAHHGTAFSLGDLIRSKDGAPTSSDASCDCHFKDQEGGELKVQWTFAGSDPFEWTDPKQAAEVVSHLKEFLDSHDHKGYRVSVLFKRVPLTLEGRRALGYALEYLVRNKTEAVGPASDPLVFTFDSRDWDYPLAQIAKYCLRFEVHQSQEHPDLLSSQQITYSPVSGKPMPMAHDRASRALEKKNRKYQRQAHDLVLVIQYNLVPYIEEREIDWVHDVLAREPGAFREIWILRDTFLPAPEAVCVYPCESIEVNEGYGLAGKGKRS